MGRKRNGEQFSCPVCSNTVYLSASQLRPGVIQTCSKACRAVLRTTGVNKVCENCGKEFYLPTAKATKTPGRFCSNKCNGEATRSRASVSCAWCKAPLTRNLWKVKKQKRHFCDLTCAHEWKRRYGTDRGRGAFTTKQKREWMDTKCAKCGSVEELQLDHIIPKFAGGSNTRGNAQTLCRICNKNKYWLSDQFLYSPDRPNSTSGLFS